MSCSTVPPIPCIKTGHAPQYPFLAYPPPSQTKRPVQSSPLSCSVAVPETRIRSSTFSAIASWAAHVQPGSPASISPRSPPPSRRHPSLDKGRRTSIASFCSPPGSFLNIAATPTTANANTPLSCQFKADLTTVGYTSVFLQLPNTPISATVPIPGKLRSPDVDQKHPTSPTRKSRLSRFRSLSVLGSRGRSKSVGPPVEMKAQATVTSTAIVKRKKAKYAVRPPPLANDLALMQFTDGGHMDDHIKRIMQAQSKAAGGNGVADVYRDGEGGIWWDQEEEWEYAHLLAEGDESVPRATGERQWVTFNGNSSPSNTSPTDEERRGSVSTQDSDLDPQYIVQPTDNLDTDDLAVFGGALVPLAARKPALSVLCLPSRPRRTAKHLRKPDFLVDVAFARMPLSPKSPFSTSFSSSGVSKPRGKARRRPVPLKLPPPSPTFKRPTNSPIDADNVRKDFLDASFQPAVPDTPTTAKTASTVRVHCGHLTNSRKINHPPTLIEGPGSSTSLPPSLKMMMRKKPSMLNTIGLFRSLRREQDPSRDRTVH